MLSPIFNPFSFCHSLSFFFHLLLPLPLSPLSCVLFLFFLFCFLFSFLPSLFLYLFYLSLVTFPLPPPNSLFYSPNLHFLPLFSRFSLHLPSSCYSFSLFFSHYRSLVLITFFSSDLYVYAFTLKSRTI